MTSRLSLVLALAGAVAAPAAVPAVLLAQPPAVSADTMRRPPGRRVPPMPGARGDRDDRVPGGRGFAGPGVAGRGPGGPARGARGARGPRAMRAPGADGPARLGGPGRLGGPVGGGDPASFFLAHTGDLKLTDAQVTRLAAIARRAGERRSAMRTRADSLRATNRPPTPDANALPGTGRPPRPAGPPMPNVAEVQRSRERSHAELRDAIAVLTADQQATVWEMMRGRPFGR